MSKDKKYRIILESNFPQNILPFGLDDEDDRNVQDDMYGKNDKEGAGDDYDASDLSAGSSSTHGFEGRLMGETPENIFDAVYYVDNRNMYVFKRNFGWNFIVNKKFKYQNKWFAKESTGNFAKIIYNETGVPCLIVYSNTQDLSTKNDVPEVNMGAFVLCPTEGDMTVLFDDGSLINAFNKSENDKTLSIIFTTNDTYTISSDFAPKSNYGTTLDPEVKAGGEVEYNGAYVIKYIYTPDAKVENGYKGGYSLYSKNGAYITSVLFADGPGMNKAADDEKTPSGISKQGESLVSKYLISKKLYEAESGSNEGDNKFAVLVKVADNNYNFSSEMTADEFASIICDSGN